MDLDALVGKVIQIVNVSESKGSITFITADSFFYRFTAFADCCSESWIEYIEDEDNLIGQKVLEVEVKEISRGEAEGHECLDVMSYDIRTDKGICKIDFRNSSNGYYGGYLKLVESAFCSS